jgi:hypothetical protein
MPTLQDQLNAMQPVFDPGRVEEAASVIADELKTLLDRFNFESPIYKRLAKSAAYSNGLTNGEDVVARLMAVNMIQSELTKKLTSLKEQHEEDEAA